MHLHGAVITEAVYAKSIVVVVGCGVVVVGSVDVVIVVVAAVETIKKHFRLKNA